MISFLIVSCFSLFCILAFVSLLGLGLTKLDGDRCPRWIYGLCVASWYKFFAPETPISLIAAGIEANRPDDWNIVNSTMSSKKLKVDICFGYSSRALITVSNGTENRVSSFEDHVLYKAYRRRQHRDYMKQSLDRRRALDNKIMQNYRAIEKNLAEMDGHIR